MRTRLVSLTAALVVLGCSDSPLASNQGSWGGAWGFRLEATAHTTTFTYGCILVDAGPLRPDASGHFILVGERRGGLDLSPEPATVVGRLHADTIFAGVFLGDVPESLPPLPFGIANAATDYSGYMCPA